MSGITMKDFFDLSEVVKNQYIQKANAFHSRQHRGAHIAILTLAENYGVEKWFESIEVYDTK